MTIPPNQSGSSGDLPGRLLERPELPGAHRVEPVYGLQAIHVLRGFQHRAIVPGPLHKVLELSLLAVASGVQDLLHVIPLLAIHIYRRRRPGPLAGERVIGGMLQERDMEHQVDPDGIRLRQPNCISGPEASTCFDLELPETAVI